MATAFLLLVQISLSPSRFVCLAISAAAASSLKQHWKQQFSPLGSLHRLQPENTDTILFFFPLFRRAITATLTLHTCTLFVPWVKIPYSLFRQAYYILRKKYFCIHLFLLFCFSNCATTTKVNRRNFHWSWTLAFERGRKKESVSNWQTVAMLTTSKCRPKWMLWRLSATGNCKCLGNGRL